MYIPNVNSILAAGLALTGGSGLMKKRTFCFLSLSLSLPSISPFSPLASSSPSLPSPYPYHSVRIIRDDQMIGAGAVDSWNHGAGLHGQLTTVDE
jgi:hypothetical protein